ncbi:hypothetical protein NKI96_10590 [Mesorhizobium sp. M0292]|uniref:hypothetical protein n=1 Tax=Mesorhizobium sp. M0292 TaxID=2956929 RepID=UPI00333CDC2C
MELHTINPEPNKIGRPNKCDTDLLYDTPLYKVLVAKLPTEFLKGGRIDTLALCKGTGNARFTVYRWFKEQRLSPKAAKSLRGLSDATKEPEKKGALTKDDLIPFLDI